MKIMQKTYSNDLHQFFVSLFEERMNTKNICNCFECNKPIYERISKETSIIYSHLLEKKKYPQFSKRKENVVICCADCHNLYTMRPKLAKKQYNAMLNLKTQYGI